VSLGDAIGSDLLGLFGSVWLSEWMVGKAPADVTVSVLQQCLVNLSLWF
jgi:hypothetical protein